MDILVHIIIMLVHVYPHVHIYTNQRNTNHIIIRYFKKKFQEQSNFYYGLFILVKCCRRFRQHDILFKEFV